MNWEHKIPSVDRGMSGCNVLEINRHGASPFGTIRGFEGRLEPKGTAVNFKASLLEEITQHLVGMTLLK